MREIALAEGEGEEGNLREYWSDSDARALRTVNIGNACSEECSTQLPKTATDG